MTQRSDRSAVIDIGSNSVRLLVADMQGRTVWPVHKDLRTTRLAKGMTSSGTLGWESIERTIAALQEFRAKAGELGASRLYCFATSAVREAKNRDEFIRVTHRQTKILVHVLSEEEEAAMGFAGTGAGEYRGVIDIGGGSTELAIGSGLRPELARSVRLGAVRAVELYPPGDIADPLTMEAMRQWCVNRMAEVLPEITPLLRQEDAQPVWYGVGGTITSLACMDQYLASYDRERVQGYGLSRIKVKRILEELSHKTLQERREITGLSPQRADIIVGGVMILATLMDVLGLQVIRVSDSDNLEGYLVSRAAGETRDRLPEEDIND